MFQLQEKKKAKQKRGWEWLRKSPVPLEMDAKNRLLVVRQLRANNSHVLIQIIAGWQKAGKTVPKAGATATYLHVYTKVRIRTYICNVCIII
jgi:hypothetical protein